MNKADLIAFEEDIIDTFERGEIKAPVHLAGGNENQLIEIFQAIDARDWILVSWRSHYHCLLKGVPPDHLKQRIIDGRSIGLCFPEHRVLASAIVGGIAPMAVGLAWAIKARGENAKVWCFLGDMTARTGIVHESMQYADGAQLPIKWVIEDNGISVYTNTLDAWGTVAELPYGDQEFYRYKLPVPHVGTGKFVRF